MKVKLSSLLILISFYLLTYVTPNETQASEQLYIQPIPKVKVLDQTSSKKEVGCPPNSDESIVIVFLGQSNVANTAEFKVPSSEVPGVFNFYNGNCYPGGSPILGTSDERGEWISLVGQILVDNSNYKYAVVSSFAVDGSHISAWEKGTELNMRTVQSLLMLQKFYKKSLIIWHQGESDLMWGNSSENYLKSFESLRSSFRLAGINSPLIINVSTRCGELEYPNSISVAQREIAKKFNDVTLGINTDLIVESDGRYDACHFNKKGQYTAALALSPIILSIFGRH